MTSARQHVEERVYNTANPNVPAEPIPETPRLRALSLAAETGEVAFVYWCLYASDFIVAIPSYCSCAGCSIVGVAYPVVYEEGRP